MGEISSPVAYSTTIDLHLQEQYITKIYDLQKCFCAVFFPLIFRRKCRTIDKKEVLLMKYMDLVFDLYGTLVDIHTEETDLVWEKTALYFGFYGAHYTPGELKTAFQAALKQREAKAGQSYECYPDIPFEEIMAQLFREKGVSGGEALGVNAAQLFRISSIEYVKLYPGVREALARLRRDGYRLWLLSNAQRIFTSYELRHLGVSDQLDGIFISSDYGCRKPDARFYQALVQEKGLDIQKCLMIGNDRETDIAGAKALGMATLYMHTELTPPHQLPADPTLHPSRCQGPHYEYEGDDWNELGKLILNISG
jgi:putative hydrolase of the HAD superfamily